MARDDDIRMRIVQRLPQGLRLRRAAVRRARAEPRVVPVGERTLLRRGREVGPEPLLLS